MILYDFNKKNKIDLNEISRTVFNLISDKSKSELTPFEQDLLKRKLIDKIHNLEFSLRADFYNKKPVLDLLNIALQLVYLNNINLNNVFEVKLK